MNTGCEGGEAAVTIHDDTLEGGDAIVHCELDPHSSYPDALPQLAGAVAVPQPQQCRVASLAIPHVV